MNIFENLPRSLPQELIETLVKSPGVRIERIISHGHATPEDFWYDQDQNEWVILLKGAARLQFESEMIELKPGDCVDIPARKRHRVAWTTPDEATVWLAVFFANNQSAHDPHGF